jgi:hypothetical protein
LEPACTLREKPVAVLVAVMVVPLAVAFQGGGGALREGSQARGTAGKLARAQARSEGVIGRLRRVCTGHGQAPEIVQRLES